MKNTFGQSVMLTLFGESHGPLVGAVLDGLAPGLPVSEAEIARQLTRRRPTDLDTARREPDPFQIVSGVFHGKTTGTPLTILIPNQEADSGAYVYGPARPSQADYAAYCKYHGHEDHRGGGHFSGRITAALVAAGGILLPVLEALGIRIGTHILQCGPESDRAFAGPDDLALLRERAFPTLEPDAQAAMEACLRRAREEKDSLGGVTQTAVVGLETGLGEPWFDSVEGLLAHALFSLGGVKGVEFGTGFGFAGRRASECNDEWMLRDGRIVTATNHNGGLNGGLTNGMPVIFQCAVKPTPTIARPQKTVDFVKDEERELTVEGRHDPTILRRICPVIDSVTALVIADLLAQRHGTDHLATGREPCSTD